MHIDHHHLVAIAIFTEATVAQLPSAPPRQPSRTMTESKIVQDMDTKAKAGKFAGKKATDKKATDKFLVKMKTYMKKKRYTRLFFAAIHIAGEWARRAVEEVELRRAREIIDQPYYGLCSQSTEAFEELDRVCYKLGFSSRLGVGKPSVNWP